MAYLVVFSMGVLGTAVLVVLKRFKLVWPMYFLPIVLFVQSSYAIANPDWRITLSNVIAMAILFFTPLLGVLYFPRFIHREFVSNLAALGVGGVTVLTFHFPRVVLTKMLGVQ